MIDLGQAGSVEVLIVDAEQNPLEGVELQIVRGSTLAVDWMPSKGQANPVRQGFSDATGRVVFEDLPIGNYAVVPLPDSEGRLGLPVRFDLTENSREVQLQMDLLGGLSIAGQLVDRNGGGQAKAYVYASCARGYATAQSSEGGQFRLGPLLPGDYDLRFVVQPWIGVASPEPFSVTAGTEDLEIVLPPGFEVMVRALDRSGTVLKPTVASVSERTLKAPALTREEGEALELFGLGAGSYSLLVGSEDGRFGWRHQIHLDPGDLGRTVDVTVQPASWLLVSDRRGLARAAYLEVYQDGAFAVSGSLRPNGRVMLHVPPGELELRGFYFEGGTSQKATQRVFARVGETVEVEWAP